VKQTVRCVSVAVFGWLVMAGPARAAGELSPAAMPAAETTPAARNEEKKFLVRPYTGFTSLDFDLTAPAGREVKFTPNSPLFVGLKLGYKGFTISGSVDLPIAEDQDTYGKTDYLDLHIGKGFHLVGHELYVEGFLQYYEGFYLENTHDLDPSVAGYLKRPDLWATSLGVAATYYFNKTFSQDTTFNEMKPREHSGGSWLVRATLAAMGFESNEKKGLIPETVRRDFGGAATMYSLASGFIDLQGGYAYDWRIWRQLLLAGAVTLGPTLSHQVYRMEDGSSASEGSVGAAASVQFGLGYGGETFHGGLSAWVTVEDVYARNVDISFYRLAFTLSGGARF
jgi:hypothetical protein